jgi:alpha,alpha-trehalase
MQAAPSVLSHPDHHTLLPLPRPFIIPGDRFRECYNWDSYWIIRGLLACRMLPAAQHLFENMLHLVDRYGFVPNGARTYYTNRSQPPLLGAMALAVWRAAGCSDAIARAALPRLLITHRYWTSGTKAVLVRQGQWPSPHGTHHLEDGGAGCCCGGSGASSSSSGPIHQLSRYYADWRGPRPESYR